MTPTYDLNHAHIHASTSQVADMYAKLETERAAHAATKGALEAARVLATDERAALSAEAEEARERVGDLEGQLASEKEWAEALADKVGLGWCAWPWAYFLQGQAPGLS